MGRHKKPPQGTGTIVNLKAQESRLDSSANKLLDDLGCYLHVKNAPLWQELKEATKDKQPPIFAALNAKFGNEIIGRAIRYYRRTGYL